MALHETQWKKRIHLAVPKKFEGKDLSWWLSKRTDKPDLKNIECKSGSQTRMIKKHEIKN